MTGPNSASTDFVSAIRDILVNHQNRQQAIQR